MERNNELLLVGAARSGTTLVCDLLNRAPGVVALDEPFDRHVIASTTATSFPDFVVAEVARQRHLLLHEGRVETTVSGPGGDRNHLFGNHYEPAPTDATAPRRPRRRTAALASIDLPEQGGDRGDVQLVVKHTIPFACYLEALRARLPMVALVRNPLAVLLSWGSIDAAYRHGRIPAYVRPHAPDLVARLARFSDPVRRQVDLVCWHAEQFEPLTRAGSVVRYEDVIETGGSCLATVIDRPVCPDPALMSHNANHHNDRGRAERLTDALLRTAGPIWDHYSHGDVERLLARLIEPTAAKPIHQQSEPGALT